MRLFFKAGTPENLEGWYVFWTAKTKDYEMVFRMPLDTEKKSIVDRAMQKLAHRRVLDPFILYESDEYSVVKWLMAHSKKSILGEYGEL